MPRARRHVSRERTPGTKIAGHQASSDMSRAGGDDADNLTTIGNSGVWSPALEHDELHGKRVLLGSRVPLERPRDRHAKVLAARPEVIQPPLVRCVVRSDEDERPHVFPSQPAEQVVRGVGWDVHEISGGGNALLAANLDQTGSAHDKVVLRRIVVGVACRSEHITVKLSRSGRPDRSPPQRPR